MEQIERIISNDGLGELARVRRCALWSVAFFSMMMERVFWDVGRTRYTQLEITSNSRETPCPLASYRPRIWGIMIRFSIVQVLANHAWFRCQLWADGRFGPFCHLLQVSTDPRKLSWRDLDPSRWDIFRTSHVRRVGWGNGGDDASYSVRGDMSETDEWSETACDRGRTNLTLTRFWSGLTKVGWRPVFLDALEGLMFF